MWLSCCSAFNYFIKNLFRWHDIGTTITLSSALHGSGNERDFTRITSTRAHAHIHIHTYGRARAHSHFSLLYQRRSIKACSLARSCATRCTCVSCAHTRVSTSGNRYGKARVQPVAAVSANWRPIEPLITQTGRVLKAGRLRPIYGTARGGKKAVELPICVCGFLSQSGTDHRRTVHSSNRLFQRVDQACDLDCARISWMMCYIES